MVSKGFLINEVDGKGEGNVIFPATFEKGSITVAVATSGKSPFMSAYLKRKISEIVSVTRKDEANKAIIASKITLKMWEKVTIRPRKSASLIFLVYLLSRLR